ncbi:MAG: hypothetical protein LBV19_01740 [Streptococcaceae bacterium]|jgi:uncharacterized membrane protein YvbJ|nr:hypothetical protein [Streptococcaceae bacterium]
MTTKEEWLVAFEAREGRKPTMEEFAAAKAAGFELKNEQADLRESETKTAISQKDIWLTDFEDRFGRKPTMDEFSAARTRDYTLEAFAQVPEKNLVSEPVQEEISQKELWLADFEKQTGRKPSMSEFQEAALRSFEILQLKINPESQKEGTDEASVKLTRTVKSSPAPKAKNKIKHKGIIFGSVGTALVLMIEIVIISFIYSKDAQLGRLSEALNSKDAAEIVKVLKVEDKDFNLSEKSLKPYVDYLKANPNELSKISDDILNDQTSQKTSDLYLKKSGSYLIFWPKYVLNMNLIYPKISVMNKGTQVKFAGKDFGQTSEDNQVLKPEILVPGEYNLAADFVMGGQPVNLNRDLSLVRYDNTEFSQNIDIQFKFTKVTIRSNSFPDADIYVDQRKVGHLNDGIAVLPQMAFTDGMQIYLTKVFPSKTLESDHIDLTEGKPDLTLDFKLYNGNISDYKTIIDNFQTQLYKTYGGLTENSNLAKYFESGSSNKGYEDFVTQHFQKIKNDVGGKFYDYRYKYFHDAQISLVDVSNNELVFNVNFTSQQYWRMVKDSEIGYQTFHWTNRQIIIDASQAKNLLENSASYNPSDGYIKIRDFGTATGDEAVYDKNFNWSSLY